MSEAEEAKRADQKRDRNFLFRTVIYALLILGIMYAFEPYMGTSGVKPDKNAVTNFAAEIHFTTSEDVGRWLQASKTPSVLMIYASWCNYCRRTMPAVFSLWQEKKFAGKRLLFISVDNSPTDLAQYLLSKELLPMIGKPVIVRTNVAPSLPAVLQSLGSNYRGGVPYMGFYAAGGEMVDEISGLAFRSAIEKSLHTLDR